MIAKLVESDINAHIVDIECKVLPENDSCEISFSNLHFGVISAVKFIAQGFNVFGDCVLVNGKEEFPLVLQDIKVEKNARLENYQVKLPDSNMRKLKLRESQICYDDGTIATYSESKIIHYIVQEYQNDDLSDDIRSARRAHYKVDFKNKPVLLDSGWVCGCGRFNLLDQQQCTACELLKVNVLRLLDEGYDDVLLDAYLKKRKKEDALEALQKKKKKTGIIIICAVFIVLAFLAALGAYMHIMSGRSTFDSEEDMKQAVIGSYTHNDAEGKPSSKIFFTDNDHYTYRIYWNWPASYDDTEMRVFKWDYKSGEFNGNIVLSDGSIKFGDTIYTKDDEATLYDEKLKIIMQELPAVIETMGNNPAIDFDKTSKVFKYAFDNDLVARHFINADTSKIDKGINEVYPRIKDLFNSAGYPNVSVECHISAADGPLVLVYRNDKKIYQYDGTTQNYLNFILSGDYTGSPERPASATPYVEDPIKVLAITNVKMENNSSYNKCTGRLTNNGAYTYRFVTVKGSFKNSNGKVLDTDWTYAVGAEGLAPGESTTFTLSVKRNTNITKCTVTLLDYDD